MAVESIIWNYKEIMKNKRWSSVWKDLDAKTLAESIEWNLSSRIAMLETNVSKNRYCDVYPYDYNRVEIKQSSDNNADYINASYADFPLADRAYILTQGPLISTVSDFWQMVWQQQCVLIVMLNKFFEKGVAKCYQYFPTELHDCRIYGNYEVTLCDVNDSNDYKKRTFNLVYKDADEAIEERKIVHFQFISWPDFGVPDSSDIFIKYLEEVRTVLHTEKSAPMVVHCSAGIGRSGTFCVADTVLSMAEKGVQEVDVLDVVLKMRRFRSGSIQTKVQLQFCWTTIVQALNKNLKNHKEDNVRTIDTDDGKSAAHPFVRSVANQMTSGLHIDSVNDLCNRKRLSSEQERERKLAKRKELVSDIQRKMKESEQRQPRFLIEHLSITLESVVTSCIIIVLIAYAIYYYTLA